ncbi:stealth family protein [Cellulomonas fimi]|uniref:Sugar phosphotransferase n=1 Tax=Cellulomonas fimi TaxID=1708 RepID=A0A7Y0QIY3_CELFI|nr:stealth family protein [Cellulomonas fimi]NMR21708.1 sugar phosphotransferase [Cellulomonas fimi]
MSPQHHPVAEEAITESLAPPGVYLSAPEAEEQDRELVEVTSHAAVVRLAARSDVVRVKGRYALVNTDRTPSQAMVEDLLFVRGVLDDAGIGYLLVRGNTRRPVLAVDWQDRKAMRRALVAACQDEPFYSMTVDARGRSALLVADGSLALSNKARILRLYRPRVEPEGGLTYGSSGGLQLELWSWEGPDVVLPVENSVTRRILPADEAVRGTVERYGHSWPTIETMFADHASDIAFDIDIVFSWVDGNSPEYRAARAAQMKGVVVGEGDDSDARFRHVDELRYALRSVYMFAPWVRHIFLVTDSSAPDWLADHPDVTIVRSEDHFRDSSVLPTHNSQAVESQLQHIEGLSEHFLYSNDDMFFGRPVGPEMFFSPGGVTKFVEATTRIGLGDNDLSRSGFENAARVNRRLLHNRFGTMTTRHLEHCPAPLRRSVLHEMEDVFAAEFAATAASRFRAKDNISVTNSLYHYYALLTGSAVTQTDAQVKYVDTTSRSGLAVMDRLLRNRSQDFFCLNDGSVPEVGADERATRVTEFLQRYFPIAAPWER